DWKSNEADENRGGRQRWWPAAWIAAERCAEAAAIVGDPVLVAAAEFSRAHAQSPEAGSLTRAAEVVDRMAEELVAAGGGWAQEAHGMPRLTAALAAGPRRHRRGADAGRRSGPARRGTR